MCLGIFDDIIRKSEFSCDGKCITLSRNTDQKAVSRTERLYIEFTTGIFNARCGKCEDFQFAVVCSTFGRVGSCIQLIEQYQRMFVYML